MFTSFNRSARRRAYVILALLPAFLFRAGIPVGYMVSFSESGATAITLCPSVATAAAANGERAEHAGHHDHGAHHEHSGQDHGAGTHSNGHEQSQPPCPFAAAMVHAATPPALVVGVAAPIASIEISTASHEAPARFPLLRAQSPRAPPALI